MDNQIFFFLILGVFLIIVFFIFISFFGKKSQKTWQINVTSKLKNLNTDHKLQLIELDKLLEYCLKNYFNQQNLSFGEIMKKNRSSFTKNNLDEIWFAHKLRNKLVHDISFTPSKSDLKLATSFLYKNIKKFVD